MQTREVLHCCSILSTRTMVTGYFYAICVCLKSSTYFFHSTDLKPDHVQMIFLQEVKWDPRGATSFLTAAKETVGPKKIPAKQK